MSNCKCNQPKCGGRCDATIRAIYVGDQPRFDMANLPANAEVVMRVTIENEITGGSRTDFIYVPPEKLQGLSPRATVSTYVPANNPDLVIPDNSVLAGRFETQTDETIKIVPADPDHRAQFVITRVNPNDPLSVEIMSNGVFDLKRAHNLIPGCDYFVGADGEPVTSGTQRMFTALTDPDKLLINLQ